MRWTTLHLVTIPSLISDVYRNASAVMSPVCSGDVDALTPGRLLTECLSPVPAVTRETLLTPAPHTPQTPHTPHTPAWSLVTLILTRRRWSVVTAPNSCLMSGDRGWFSDMAGTEIWKDFCISLREAFNKKNHCFLKKFTLLSSKSHFLRGLKM